MFPVECDGLSAKYPIAMYLSGAQDEDSESKAMGYPAKIYPMPHAYSGSLMLGPKVLGYRCISHANNLP